MYFDIQLKDWEKVECLDVLSAHDEEWRITASFTYKGTWYCVEAVGMYSCGELVGVIDEEVTDCEPIFEEE